MTKANEAAFTNAMDDWNQVGLTKREYFAAMAMKGYLSNHLMVDNNQSNNWIAASSVNAADALINALNETE
jgi:hypothetical protein